MGLRDPRLPPSRSPHLWSPENELIALDAQRAASGSELLRLAVPPAFSRRQPGRRGKRRRAELGRGVALRVETCRPRTDALPPRAISPDHQHRRHQPVGLDPACHASAMPGASRARHPTGRASGLLHRRIHTPWVAGDWSTRSFNEGQLVGSRSRRPHQVSVQLNGFATGATRIPRLDRLCCDRPLISPLACEPSRSRPITAKCWAIVIVERVLISPISPTARSFPHDSGRVLACASGGAGTRRDRIVAIVGGPRRESTLFTGLVGRRTAMCTTAPAHARPHGGLARFFHSLPRGRHAGLENAGRGDRSRACRHTLKRWPTPISCCSCSTRAPASRSLPALRAPAQEFASPWPALQQCEGRPQSASPRRPAWASANPRDLVRHGSISDLYHALTAFTRRSRRRRRRARRAPPLAAHPRHHRQPNAVKRR